MTVTSATAPGLNMFHVSHRSDPGSDYCNPRKLGFLTR